MYLLILCIIVWVILSIIAIKDEEYGVILVWLIVVAVMGGIISLVGGSVLDSKHSHKEYMDLPIVSLNVDKQLEGSGNFFLGIGGVSLETATYYVAYGKFVHGLKRVKVDAYDTYVKETDREKPKIKHYWYRDVCEPYESNWFWGKKKTEYGDWYRTSTWDDNIVIIVPTNTIYKEFKIDE